MSVFKDLEEIVEEQLEEDTSGEVNASKGRQSEVNDLQSKAD